MIKRMVGLVAVLLLMAASLAACGDGDKAQTGTVPVYPNGTSVILPADVTSKLDVSANGTIKNGKVDTYTTTDASEKAKTTIADAFKKNGWEDKTQSMNLAQANKDGNSQGIYSFGFQAGDKAAVVVVMPASFASMMGAKAPDGGAMIIISNGSK